MRDFLFRLADGFRRLHREEEGVIIACSLAVFLFLYVLGCGVYALGTTIYEREALQNAADAAAYSAASIQADALSRMAMLNKALSYTYIQMSRKQMDCITAKWLKLVHDRYVEDSTWAKNWACVLFVDGKNLPVDLFSFIKWAVEFLAMNNGLGFQKAVKNCRLLNKANGEAWFCGSEGQEDVISINEKPVPKAVLQGIVTTIEDERIIPTLKASIVADKQTIVLLNNALADVHQTMCDSVQTAIASVLVRNLRAAFGESGMADFYYSSKSPEAEWNPYLAAMNPSEETATQAGYFNVLTNVENDERRFLGMAGHTVVDGQEEETAGWNLTDFFVSSQTRNGGGKSLLQFFNPSNKKNLQSAGFDQWFVRGAQNVRAEGAAGIQRTFWTTNAKERLPPGALQITRGNHLLSGNLDGRDGLVQQILSSILSALVSSLDVQPSVGNSPPGKQVCKHINDTQALVAEYEWATAKWFAWDLIKKKEKKWSPLRRWWCNPCRKKYPIAWGHLAIPKTYCGESDYRKGRFWHDIEGNAREMFMMGNYWKPRLATHGYIDKPKRDNGKELLSAFNILKGIKTQFGLNRSGKDIPRESYESCAMGLAVGTSPLFLRGNARIYGDDKSICHPHVEVWTNPDGSAKTFEELIEEVNVYDGARAEPWILSERFFGPDGTIFVAVAKRRRNPWAQLAGAVVASVRNLASIGNPEGTHPTAEGTFMWTVSAGRAAFRDPETGELCGHYKYLNPEGQNDALGAHGPGESGCVCDTAPERLRRQWNLCVTEWEPTLVPVAVADAFRAVADAGGRGHFVPNPHPETSGLAKVLHWDLDGGKSVTTASEEERGWLPLSGTGSAKKEDTFLQVVAPPGTDEDKRFGPKDGADWPKTLWPRKIL